jgi:glycerol kinase
MKRADLLLLAIDQGTHATRAIAFDLQGRALAQAQRPVSLQHTDHGAVEQSPAEILHSMQAVVGDVLHAPVVAGRTLLAAGLATQRSSVLAWDRVTGAALSPVLSWQDTRTANRMEQLAPHAQQIMQVTGLRLSPHYGAGKLQWLLTHEPAVARAQAAGTLALGPLASYLLHHLTDCKDEQVDHANAARTLLWNLGTRDWDPQLLELFAIPRAALPVCRPICAAYGNTVHGGIPVTAVNGDQTAALYAQGRPPAGTLMVNIGTGAFVLLPVQDPYTRPAGLLGGISWSTQDAASYYLEGTVNAAGAALQWAGKHFDASRLGQQLPGWLAQVREPPLFLNSVGGLGAPWWRSGPAPRWLAAAVQAPEAMVAVVESIVFLLQANIAALCTLDRGIDTVRISGGLAKLDGLCQKLADLSGLVVQRPAQLEATARGIAWQAAGCPADWPASGGSPAFTPQPNATLQARYSAFLELLESASQER